jgi:hypothetical protein
MRTFFLLFFFSGVSLGLWGQCPTVSVSFSDTSICNGESTILRATTSGGTGPFTYVWSSGITTDTTSGLVNSAGTYTVTVTDSNGCTVTASSPSLTVNPLPTVTITGTNTICAGASTTFTASSGTSYAWSNSATTAATTVSTATTYTVTVTDANGCTNTSNRTLTVNPNPTASPAFTNNPICSGNNTTLSANASAGSGNINSYQWSSGVTGSGSTVTVANSGTYTVTVTNSNGCTVVATTTTSLTVNPTPSVSPITNQTHCNGASTNQINFNSTVTGTSFSWSNNNGIGNGISGNGNTINSFSVNNTTSNTITSTFTVTPTANGCTGTPQTFTITVKPTPTVAPISNQNKCNGTNTNLIAFTGTVSNTTFDWISSQNIGNGPNGSGNINSFPVVNNTNIPITSTYTVTPTANLCIGNPRSFDITVNPTPTLSPIANQVLCAGEATIMTTFWSPVQGTTYSWVNSNQAIGLGGNGTGNINSFTSINNGLNPNISNIAVTASANSCIFLDTFTITVNPIPVVNAGNDTTICNGQGIILIGTGALAYDWTSNVINNQIFYPQASNVYQVTGFNQYNCSNTDFININVNASPVLELGQDIEICNGETISLNVQFNNATWSGITNNSGSSLNFQANNSGMLYCEVSNGNCNAVDSIFITVRPRPNVSAGNDQNICSGQTVQLSGSGALTYFWSSGVNNNQPFFPTATNSYTVTGYNQFNCSATDVVNVTVVATPNLNLGNDKQICLGDTVSLSTPFTNSQWSGITNVNSQNLQFVPQSSGFLICQVSGSNCASRDSIYVLVNPIPYPLITGASTACENSYWQKYEVAPTSNGLNWTINNGEIQAGFGTNEVYVHWFNGQRGILTVEEYDWNNGCSNKDDIAVTFGDTALEPAEIRLLFQGGNVLHTVNDYPVMNWGYESAQTHIPVYLGVTTQYCTIQNFDPSNYNYWVEIGDGNGCLTKSYYNTPVFPIAVTTTDNTNNYKLYPNPATEEIFIEIENTTAENINYQIIDLSGRLVKQGMLTNRINGISVAELTNAVYFVQLIGANETKVLKFVKS